jgi:predicted signal transduction protein with EAL and GGDEF domain
MSYHRNPKPRRLTDEQEAEYARTEAILYRARIIERGVAVLLNQDPCDTETAIASEALAEAVRMREEAQEVRSSIRRAEMQADMEAQKRSKPRQSMEPKK